MSTNKAHILIIVPFAFHRESGSSLSTFYRILSVAELCQQVDVLTTCHGKDIYYDNISLIRTPKKPVFKTLEPGQYKKKLIYEVFLFFKAISLLSRKKYDVVIVHGSSIYWACILQLFFKAPFVATVHGNIQIELEKWNISKSTLLKKIAARIENTIINSFKQIVAEHVPVVDILINSGINKNKITLIHIGVKSAESIRCSDQTNVFTILYTGTFVKVQHIELLYQAMSLIKHEHVQLVLVGGIDSEVLEEKRLIEAYDLKDHVTVIGRLPQSELLEYYKKANIVVSPRVYGHDTPMKVFDYLNFGKCILASDRPIHTGILTKEVAYLAEPTPQDYADAILYLKNHPEIVRQMEVQGKQYFEDNFELKNMTKKYKEVLQKV